MTHLINFMVCGDSWVNRNEVVSELQQIPIGHAIALDLASEGPSLSTLGIRQVIDNWLAERQQHASTVSVVRWPNDVEYVPYNKVACSSPSHFFFMSQDYWIAEDPELQINLDKQKLFGIFIGRTTWSRAVIMYECMTQWGRRFMASKMKYDGEHFWYVDQSCNTERLDQWLPLHQSARMFQWYEVTKPVSIDSKSVDDQFTTTTSYVNTNTSLLNHYARFSIELVCETYTLGSTFFPTEKTIRPIMAAKPFVIYGPQDYLARLRGMGFKTYHELWDESYDSFQGPQRWELMKRTIGQLMSLDPDTLIELLTQAHEIALYNRQLLDTITHDPPMQRRARYALQNIGYTDSEVHTALAKLRQ